MQTPEELALKLRAFIFETFPIARQQEIADSASLIEQGIVDSMGILEIVTYLESEFAIVLSDDEMLGDNFESIDSLAKFVRSKLSESVSAES